MLSDLNDFLLDEGIVYPIATNIEKLLATKDGTDVIFNSSGTHAVRPLDAYTIDQMAALHSLIVLQPIRVNNAVLPMLRTRQSRLIVWITSTLGRVLPDRGGLYPATKW